MHSLKELIEDALASTDNDADLAKALADSGALEEIVRQGTYGDAVVRQRLNYASEASLRAALSKARRTMGAFPVPILEGRRWARSTVEEYRKGHRRTAPTAT